ncbi:hypothetical protein JCM24511_06827 [Saitozyma sp. JCM 24511]|nr:hypothetical protein JCM24511_06827 [Saitozyma sp. JCM 24511]
MSLLATLQSYQAPALLLLTIFGPSLLPRLLRLFRRDPNPRPPSRPPRKPLSSTVKLILALHTAWSIYSLLFPPYNIFSTHSLPILAPNDLVRAKVLGQPRTTGTTSPATTSETLTLTEHLLSRLANLDTRYLYARFGHQPLLECLWCQNINDYLLVSIPSIVLPYAVRAVILGVLGWTVVGGEQAGTRANRWRSTTGWILVTAGTAEVGAKYLWSVRAVEGDCVHLASVIHIIRTTFLLLLPIIYTYLPLPSANPLRSLLPALSNTHSTLRLTSLARAAVSRTPALRRIWSIAGEEGAEQAALAREDGHVRSAARALGLEAPEVRENAGRWIEEGWRGM